MEKFTIISKNSLENLPKTAGVYVFYQKSNRGPTPIPIYIGKAINLKSRVKNHFFQPSYRDNLFMDQVQKIGFIETGSEISALILEANLIKKYQPKYNVVWKDDKNYFYVAIAQNKLKIPYVFITHQPDTKPKNIFIGPFVDGNAVKKTIRFLRKVFPYYSSAKHPKIKCGYCHIDLCPGPDPDIAQYKKNIKKFILVLRGKSLAVLRSLKKEMKMASGNQDFEGAGKLRDQIFALERIISHANVQSTGNPVKNIKANPKPWSQIKKDLAKIIATDKKIRRIEAYDVSNIQGKFATASMVVFTNGKPDKAEYKKFRIRMKQEPNDIAMLKETLTRRFYNKDWKIPEVILIDGGKAQLNVAINSKTPGQNIKIVSIAKGRQELFIENQKNPIPLKNLPQEIFNLIANLDSEAHRFAITYHRKLRAKNLLK